MYGDNDGEEEEESSSLFHDDNYNHGYHDDWRICY